MILFHAIVVHHNPKHLSVGVGGGGDSFRLWPMMVTSPSRNVMVVVDPSPQSAAALQYALSHAWVEQDKLILFYIENSTSWENAFSTFLRKSNNSSSSTPNIISEGPFGTDVDFLDQMRRACEIARPKINVKIEKTDMDGKDKASVILSKSKDLRIDLIVIGQKRSISSAILGWVFIHLLLLLTTNLT